jgi:hypothetical protein
MQKYIVYYTDNKLEENLDVAVRTQIERACGDIPIISVSQVPMSFGKNICVERKPRSYQSLYEQVLIGLKAAKKDSIIYLCEHDVFYNPSHFEFVPPEKDKIYFNLNRAYYRLNLNTFAWTVGRRAFSQAVAYREVLIELVEKKVMEWINGCSSFLHGPFTTWVSEYPNVDIRHSGNFSSFATKKKSYEKGEMVGLLSIDYWGTPEEFRRAVGYKNWRIGTRRYLKQKFENSYGTCLTRTIPNFDRGDLAELFKKLKFTKGAEIGVKRGEYAVQLCASNPFLTLMCVDPWNPYGNYSWDTVESFFVEAKNRLRLYPNAKIIRKTSMQAANVTPKASLDFVYIDAAHDFNNVMRDIILWTDRVRPAGIVSGHDYDNPDVRLAVDTYTKVHGLDFYLTDQGKDYPDSSPSWFFAKGDL